MAESAGAFYRQQKHSTGAQPGGEVCSAELLLLLGTGDTGLKVYGPGGVSSAKQPSEGCVVHCQFTLPCLTGSKCLGQPVTLPQPVIVTAVTRTE